MNIYLAVSIICPGAKFNPACFDFDEDEARRQKLWQDSRPMPTVAQLEECLRAHELAEEKIGYKRRRKVKYEKKGLSFNRFVELLIEDDREGIAKFRSEREEIKLEEGKFK